MHLNIIQRWLTVFLIYFKTSETNLEIKYFGTKMTIMNSIIFIIDILYKIVCVCNDLFTMDKYFFLDTKCLWLKKKVFLSILIIKKILELLL